MDDQSIQLEGSSPQRRNQPLVGFHVDQDISSDTVAGTILRAKEAGHDVLILSAMSDNHETVKFAERLGATVVDAEIKSEAEFIDTARAVARGEGYPGLIYVSDPTIQVDYQATRMSITGSTEYAVSPIGVKEDEDKATIMVGIPAYNEEIGIGSVVLGVSEYADEVVVIDDGSDDRTAELAEQAGATVIRHDTNQGKGAAVKTLMQYAQNSGCEALVLIDGDGQHKPPEISAVVDPVLEAEADLVIGSRYIDGNDDETPLHRRAGQRILDLVTMASSRERVSDSQSGFRALSPAAIEAADIQSSAFGVESGMIDSLADEDMTIQEVPIDVRYEEVPNAQTQNPLRHGLAVVLFLLQLIRDKHPLVVFGIPGLLITSVGVWYGVDAILIYQSTDTFYPAKVMVSGFLSLIGIAGFFTGLILNRMNNFIRSLEESES